MLKAIARKLVRKDDWEFVSWYRTRFGFVRAIGAYINLLSNKRIGRAPNELTGGVVFLRPGTADQEVYDEIFVTREYALDLGDPQFIVDAGAHIGLASVYFASRYPNATIVAIEPEPSNFEMLLMNTRAHPNIKPIQAGLWSKKTHLRIQDSSVSTWAFRVSESPSGDGLPALGLADIIAEFKVSQIDVLKIDIEGAEVEVLNNSHSWIDKVRALIIELHDRFQPGCTAALENALDGRDYSRTTSGESVVITNMRPIAK